MTCAGPTHTHIRRIACLAVSLALAACGGESTSSKDGSATCSGGPAVGPVDTHCQGDGGGIFIGAVDPTMCTANTDTGAADYGDTMYNTAGRDDDCKYIVSYSVDPICENEGVTFTVIAKYAKDGTTPVTGAKTKIEAFLTDTHPAPNSGVMTTESPPGTYAIGPVKFDASGMWTVRFHFFEDCEDADGSPHGHAAFFVNVP